jgi:uncharacterized protein (DUF924 family)
VILQPLTARLAAPAAALSLMLAPAPSSAAEPAPLGENPENVVSFWQEAGPSLWFAKDRRFDHRFRERFLALHEAAARGELANWQATPPGALALLILLDQYPRNAFRGTARMYATDALARSIAERAIERRYDREIPPALRVFVYLPYGHSESLADQNRSVQLAAPLGEPSLSHARHHREIVRRFGRFPHRNDILGRRSTAEERAYLAAGGYAG